MSICIANYNGAEVIETCLRSVFKQNCGFPFEVIVHDDCSTDNSPGLVRELFPKARLIVAEENCGFCVSNNRMAKIARGKYLLLLNNDTKLHVGALEAMYECAENLRMPAVLTLPQYDMATGNLLDRGMFIDLFANPIPNLAPGNREVATVMGSCLWIDRALWQALDGLPEWFESMAEDMYLCTRARLMGCPVMVVDQSGYDHKVGHSFGGGKIIDNRLSTSYWRRSLSELNKNRVMLLCFPMPRLLPIALLHGLSLVVEGLLIRLLQRSTKPLSQIYLPSLLRPLKEVRRMLNLRLEIQRGRRVSNRKFYSTILPTHQKLVLLRRHGVPKIN